MKRLLPGVKLSRRTMVAAQLFGMALGLTIVLAPPASANNQFVVGPTHSVCDSVNNGCAFMRSSILVSQSSALIRGYTDVWCTLNGSAAACTSIQGMAVYVYRQGVVDPSTLLIQATGADCTGTCPSTVRALQTLNAPWQLSYSKVGATTWKGNGASRVNTRVFTPGGRLVLNGDGTTSPDGVTYCASTGWVNA